MKREDYVSGGESNSSQKFWFIVVAVLLAGILVAVSFNAGLSANPSQIVLGADGKPEVKTMSVSGSVTKYVTPDKVDIVLSVETLDLSAQKSQSDNAVIADKVRKALSGIGVISSDIKTVSYSVNEDFEWNDYTRKSESIGYKTVNQIQVTLSDTAKAGTVVDAAVQAGANRVSSIAFGLSDKKELEVKKTALSEAATTAKTKAESIASGLGVSLGKVYSISESSYYYTPNYSSYEMAKDASAGSAPTQVSAGDVEVTASVSVSFEIN
ncbi:MAG: SIMPL domain-containing protein [archaeon]